MQEQAELNWVGYVLSDVITFLAENDMMESAKMLSIAAAHIDHDMRRQDVRPETTGSAHTNVLAFPVGRRRSY
jgi:hypothetical protein